MSKLEAIKKKLNWNIQKTTFCTSVIVAALITIAAINNLVKVPKDFQVWILNIHYIILSLLLVVSELRIQFFARNFGLLKFITGKGLYILFLGTLLIDYQFSFQLIVSVICIACGFIYIVGVLSTIEPKEDVKEKKDKKNKKDKKSKEEGDNAGEDQQDNRAEMTQSKVPNRA